MTEWDWTELDRRIEALGRQAQIDQAVRKQMRRRDRKRRLRDGIAIAAWCAGMLASFLWLASVVWGAYR